MPLLYAIDGRPAAYETITPIQPIASISAATLSIETARQDLGQEQNVIGNNFNNKRATLKAYDEATNAGASERKPVLCAQDIMTKSVIHLKATATLAEARELMQTQHIRHVPILRHDETLIGILSDRDLLRAGSELQLPVSSQMSARPLTATADTTIQEIAHAMLTHQIHAMPIVDLGVRVVGMLTTADILRAIVKRAPLELWV